MRSDLETDRDRLRRALGRPAVGAQAPEARRASVAVVLSPQTAGPELWFILRAVRSGDPWSGQIAFPGGRMETADRDPLHTAVRETREELGLELESAEVLGPLDDLAPISGAPQLVVHPWVFWASAVVGLSPSPAEVAHVFPVPLRTLAEGVGRSQFAFDWRGARHLLPCVDLETPAGTGRLWGMTLRIVDDLLHRLDGGGVGLARNRGGGGDVLAEPGAGS